MGKKVNCKTREKIDRLQDALSEGGEVLSCGWLKDKYWNIPREVLQPNSND
jgi:predicted 3-demethylubiquinone-9 3-methyltransferase (glyoxalase superfamily)